MNLHLHGYMEVLTTGNISFPEQESGDTLFEPALEGVRQGSIISRLLSSQLFYKRADAHLLYNILHQFDEGIYQQYHQNPFHRR